MSKKNANKKQSKRQNDAADFAAAPVIDIGPMEGDETQHVIAAAAVEILDTPAAVDQFMAEAEPVPVDGAAILAQLLGAPVAAPIEEAPAAVEVAPGESVPPQAEPSEGDEPAGDIPVAVAPAAPAKPVDPKRSEACKRAWDTIRKNRELRAQGLMPEASKKKKAERPAFSPRIAAWLGDNEFERNMKTQTVIGMEPVEGSSAPEPSAAPETPAPETPAPKKRRAKAQAAIAA